MVEHRADNAGVSGSIPLGPINEATLFQVRQEEDAEKVYSRIYAGE